MARRATIYTLLLVMCLFLIATVSQATFLATADLAVTKTSTPNPVLPGMELRYTITVSNHGPDTAAEVFLSDGLPPQVTFVAVDTTQGQCGYDATFGPIVSCDLGALAPGATVWIDIVVLVAPEASGILTNGVSLSAPVNDPDFTNDFAETQTVIQADADGDAVADDADNCPDMPNPEQSDTDGDGQGNACDGDNDNDSVPDDADNCLGMSNPEQTDTDANGVGDGCETAVPDIGIDRDFFDFPAQTPGGFFDLPLTITNRGSAPLQGTVTHPTDANFFLFKEHPSRPGQPLAQKGRKDVTFYLEPGQSEPLIVRFYSQTLGSFADTMLIQSNDPDQPTLEVTLAGSVALTRAPSGKRRAYVLLGNRDGIGPSVALLHAFSDAEKRFEQAGFEVISRVAASAQDAVEALADPDTEVLWIGGHGLLIENEQTGAVTFSEVIRMIGDRITSDPQEATSVGFLGQPGGDSATVLLQPNPRIRAVYLQSCGQDRPGWRALFPNAAFFGWKDSVTAVQLWAWQFFHDFEELSSSGAPAPAQPRTARMDADTPPRVHPILQTPTEPVPGDPEHRQCVMDVTRNSFPLSPYLRRQMGPQQLRVVGVSDDGRRRDVLYGLEIERGRVMSEADDVAAPTAEVVLTRDALHRALNEPTTLVDSFLRDAVRVSGRQGDPDERTLFKAYAHLLYGVALPEVRLQVHRRSMAGVELPITARLINRNETEVRHLQVHFFVDGQRIGTQQVASIAPNKSVHLQEVWSAIAGAHVIEVRAGVDTVSQRILVR